MRTTVIRTKYSMGSGPLQKLAKQFSGQYFTTCCFFGGVGKGVCSSDFELLAAKENIGR